MNLKGQDDHRIVDNDTDQVVNVHISFHLPTIVGVTTTTPGVTMSVVSDISLCLIDMTELVLTCKTDLEISLILHPYQMCS